MKKLIDCRGFSKKGLFFACLFFLLFFASNAFADLFYSRLIYAGNELNSGKLDNYAKVTVNLTSQDHATITFQSQGKYTLQDRLGVQINAWIFSVNKTKGTFEWQSEFDGFGYFNASFSGLSNLTSYSFDVTRGTMKGSNDYRHWNSAKDVLVYNDWGYWTVANIVPQTGNAGYAAGSPLALANQRNSVPGEAGGAGLNSSRSGSAVVPLPGAVWLLGPGLLGLAGIKRRGGLFKKS